MTSPPAVVLVDADASSGMATMLADLLEANLRDFRSRRVVASVARGDVVFTAADRDISVTLSFKPGAIEVSDGAFPDVPVVTAPWLAMARVCSGTESPWAAWRSGQLQVQHLQRAPVAAAASWVLSVPASFYEATGDAAPRRWSGAKLPIVAGLVLGATALTIYISRRYRK